MGLVTTDNIETFTTEAKTCTKCGTTRALDDFPRDRSRPDGRFPHCKPCNVANVRNWRDENPEKYREQNRRISREYRESGRQRVAQARYKYGVEPEDFDRMLDEQEGACGICRKPFGDKQPHIDHDHDTGEVRELLCGPCNRTIGFARECPDRLRAAADYIEKHGGA